MRKLLLALSVFSALCFSTILGAAPESGRNGVHYPIHSGEVVPIPVYDPIAQRGQEFVKWLSPGVRIAVPGARGSGTICYYDSQKNLAYVISCGHLWDKGALSAAQALQKNITCEIDVFYHNEQKLPNPKTYQAKLLFYSHLDGADYSLMSFTPDWQPDYAPIAPLNFPIPKGSKQHSIGCDKVTEVANYEIEIIGIQGDDLVTFRNSPRPGRSGGGLLTNEGWFIGICWGTEFRDGSGKGYFTPLSVIHAGFQKNGYGFILGQSLPSNELARKIPIRDRTGPQVEYPKDYVPLPGRP
jgi:hypothetical protein